MGTNLWKNKNWENARKHFGIVGDSNMVLHHKDESLKANDFARYCEWRVEDLIVMTREEHTIHHWTGRKQSEESIEKMRNAIKGRHFYNNGIKEVYRYECPDGFVKGRLPYSDETKAKISNSLKGNKNASGRVLTEEHKRKISESKMGKRKPTKGNSNEQRYEDATP